MRERERERERKKEREREKGKLYGKFKLTYFAIRMASSEIKFCFTKTKSTLDKIKVALFYSIFKIYLNVNICVCVWVRVRAHVSLYLYKLVSKVDDRSRGQPEGSIFISSYTEV